VNEHNLHRLRKRVAVPRYRRDHLHSGVVDLGVGSYQRAHQAVYFDDLANLGLTRWGITGVGFRSRRLRQVLADPDHPTTAFGNLVAGLEQRWRAGGKGLTVLSCDNQPDSAVLARACVLALAEQRDPALAHWVEDCVRFPDSMVDRITQATEDRHRELAREHGVLDSWPVVTEPFSQWVIEDAFASTRPPLDQVGAQFVGDVAPAKRVKTRLLNGTHCALGYLGTLAGSQDTASAMAEPAGRTGLHQGPGLPPALAARGGRTGPPPRVARPRCRRLVPLPARQRPDRPTDRPTRPRSTELGSLARRGATDPRPLLGLTEVFGDLGQHGNVVDILERQLRSLDEQGWRASLVASLAADGVQSPTCPVRVHQPDPIPGGERPCRLLILT